MKDCDGGRSNDQSKRLRGRLKKYKLSTKPFARSCWPKVMVSRDNRICKRTNVSPEITSLTFLEGSSSKLPVQEEEEAVEHLCCKENASNFEDEQSVCLISSSSEIQEHLRLHDGSLEDEENPETQGGSVRDGEVDCSTVEVKVHGNEKTERPIFVDLTADEKNTWKQTILKRFCDLEIPTTMNEEEAATGNCSANVVLEPRIMIADSSSKLHCIGSGSLATALRDRVSCLIPVQPNRSLPIRPAPLVPMRSLRNDCSPFLFFTKPVTLDVVDVESVKSIADGVPEEKNCEEKGCTKESLSSVEYVIPQISSVGSLSGIKRKINYDLEFEKDGVKENKKKKRSQEADSSQNKEKRVESSIKEFLKNFCGSNETGGTQNACTDKCGRFVSSTKENNKLVPPLRLKKVARTETGGYSNSEVSKETEHESNYRIITGATPGPQSSTVSISWNDVIYENNFNSSFNSSTLKTDNLKLKYRRNRLKQKLRELRGKALELAKQISDDSSPQCSTGLRQAMNRYEKQMENLTKLHGKLSAALSVSNEVIDVNDDAVNSPEDESLLVDPHETNNDLLQSNSSGSSPEPPTLSPRLPLNYENLLPEDIRDSPPILPRVSLAITSSHDSVGEDLQVSDKKIWSMSEDTIKSMLEKDNCIDEGPQDLQECLQTSTLKPQDTVNVDVEDSELGVSKRSLNRAKKIQERSNLAIGFSSGPLIVQNPEKIACLEYSEPGPGISSIATGAEDIQAVRGDKMLRSNSGERVPSSGDPILRAAFEKVNENGENLQKVSPSSNQIFQGDSMGSGPNQKHLTGNRLQTSCKEGTLNDINQRPNHISEQFPSLGNWLARISKKQVSKSKPKSQPGENGLFSSTEHAGHTPGCEIQKMMGPNSANNIINASPQCTTDRWQYNHHQQQQRQQQLLQHVAASVSLSQPVPAVPQLRPAICGPIPITQFYPNNYAIDPYNGYPAIWPYGAYPYHSRLHTGYHFPIQESLRPLLHVDKRFPSVQDPMMRYPAPSTSNLDVRSNSTSNIGSGAIPSLFLPTPSLSSTQQAIPRAPLTGYPPNAQFPQNRMFPDVVAAAAAAAVVAAASFDRQRDAMPTLPTAGIANIINRGSPHVSGPSKVINRDISSQGQDRNFTEGHENGSKYQQVQNFLFDRLALVKTPVSVIGGDTQGEYRMSLVGSHAQTNNSSDTEFRNCETPHLGKVNHSLNNLHNLSCSNCGVLGPKFKCLGCELVFYCNERCQERHWKVHVQRCPKRMPKLKKVT